MGLFLWLNHSHANITKCWAPLLRSASTISTFNCCLFVSLSAIRFVFTKWILWLVGLRSGVWLTFISFKCSCVSCYVLVHHLCYEPLSFQFFSIWLNLYRKHILQNKSCFSISTRILNIHQCPLLLATLHVHAIMLPPCLMDDVVYFRSFSHHSC